jgi:hypothetical protein
MNAMTGVMMAFESKSRRAQIPGPFRGSENAANSADTPIEI